MKRRQIETLESELKSCRQKCHEYRRENKRQLFLVQRQKKDILRAEGKVQILQQLVYQSPKHPKHSTSGSVALGLSTTSVAEENLMNDLPETEEGPESSGSTASGSCSLGGKSMDSGHIRDGTWTAKTNNKTVRRLKNQVAGLTTMMKELSQQNHSLGKERDRWVKLVNIQSQKTESSEAPNWANH